MCDPRLHLILLGYGYTFGITMLHASFYVWLCYNRSWLNFITCSEWQKGYVFIYVSWFVCLVACLLLGLFVCLSATLRGNGKTDLYGIFRIGQSWYKEQQQLNMENMWGVMFNPYGTGFLFLCFQGNPCLTAILRKKGWMNFHEIFRQSGIQTRNNRIILGILWLTSWIQDRFSYLLDVCLLAMLCKMGEQTFMKFSWNVTHNMK